MIKVTDAYDPDALGLRVAKRLGGDELLVFCPFHSDRHPSAEYNVAKGVFYCFGCKESRTAEQLASELGGALVPLGTRRDRKMARWGEPNEWRDLLKNPPAYDNEYLKGRDVTDEQVLKFNIRANRDGVIFPLIDKWGESIGAQIRHYKRQPKYLTMGSRPVMWPLLHSWIPWDGPIFIVEGVFGVVRADMARVTALAILGSHGTKEVAEWLHSSGHGRQAVVFTDRDPAGLLAAGKFVLHDIPAIIPPARLPAPDELSVTQWSKICDRVDQLKTYDVNEVIGAVPARDRDRIDSQLRSYWRKINE